MSSRVRLVVVMDPIEAIKPAKDSTLAILLAAQARGWQLFYAEQEHLWLRDGIAWGRLAPLRVFDDLGTWFARGETRDAKLGEFDVILMRKDPPFDTEYINTTYILERAEVQGALVCNRPQGLRDMNEKVYSGLVSRVLCALTHHPRHARYERIPARAWQGRMQAPRRNGRQVHLRPGRRRQEPQCRIRNVDRIRLPVCHRAAISAGNRDRRRLPGPSGGRGARALCPAADPHARTTTAVISPPGRVRREPPAQRA